MKLSVTCKKIMALVLCCALLLTALVIPSRASADSTDPSVSILGVSLKLDNEAGAGTQALRIAIKVDNANAAKACAISVKSGDTTYTVGTSPVQAGVIDRQAAKLYSKDTTDNSIVYAVSITGIPAANFANDFVITGKAWGIDGTLYTSGDLNKSINSAAASIAAAFPALGIVLKDDGCLYKNNGDAVLGSNDIMNYVEPVYTATFEISGADGATIDVFHTQDTTTASETNVTTAVARDSITGASDVSGNGQINFKVNIPDGYVIKEVTATEGQYKNIKPVDAGTYRVTKITGDLTILIVLEPDSGVGPYDDGDDTKHTALFDLDEHVSGIDVYHTQDTSGDPDEVNVTTAIARNSTTGDTDIAGTGQINFKVKTADGYVVDKVEVLTGTFTNVKTVDEAAGIYRITKVTSDLEVSITTKAAATPTEEPSPEPTPTTEPTAEPTATPQIVKAFSLVESMDDIEEGTEYAIVSGGTITPNNMSSGYYYIKDEAVSGSTTKLDFAAFNASSSVVEETTLWTFEKGNDGYAIRSAAIQDDSAAYMNVSSSGAAMGAKQELAVTLSGSTFTIMNGTYRIRFTNTGGSGYTSGTNAASGTVRIYEVVEEEVGPEPVYPFVKAAALEEATEYAIVMTNIQPTGLGMGDYYMKDTNVAGTTTLMDYASFSVSTPSDEVSLWELEETEGGYAIRAVSIDNDDVAYLNITDAGVTMGALQELTIAPDGSVFVISNGSNRLRFTNSGNGGSTPGFYRGSNAASSQVTFYEAVD